MKISSGGRPVSYTHLDVYKRQDKGHPIYDIIGYAETREAGNIMLAEYNRDPWDVCLLYTSYTDELFRKYEQAATAPQSP